MTRYVWINIVHFLATDIHTFQGNLSAKGRPEEVHQWLKYGRQFDKSPVIKNAKDYGIAWLAWWRALQPKWRIGGGILPPAVYSCELCDWGALQKSGKNGLFIVLISMVWWGRAGTLTDDWKAAITDVKNVMQSMLGTGSKRAIGAEAETPVITKRYAFIILYIMSNSDAHC